MPRVSWWLQEVKQDLDTPDLWAELRHETELLEAGSNKVIENTLFTLEEQREIARRLNKLEEDVRRALSLSGPQTQVLHERIDYLVEASNRLGRKDWLNTFIGVTLSFVLTAALAPEAARALFRTFFRAIGLLYPEISHPRVVSSGLLTLNQRIQGSNPCAPTIDLTTLFPFFRQNQQERLGPVGRSVGSFCSPFELSDRALSKRRVAAQVVRIDDRAHAVQQWLVMVAISASVQLASASRVTAVPRKS